LNNVGRVRERRQRRSTSQKLTTAAITAKLLNAEQRRLSLLHLANKTKRPSNAISTREKRRTIAARRNEVSEITTVSPMTQVNCEREARKTKFHKFPSFTVGNSLENSGNTAMSASTASVTSSNQSHFSTQRTKNAIIQLQRLWRAF